MINSKILRTISIACALVAFGAGIGIYTARQQQSQLPPQIEGLMSPEAKNLKPFSVIDQEGQQFTLQNLQEKWSFLFFGYTNCPDICPITLSIFEQVHKKLGSEHSGRAQMIFVSVDPARDTTEKLHDYVNYFNEDFIGLGGSIEQIQSLTGQLGIPFFPHESNAEGDYLVDHSASIFLINPRGQLIAVMSAPHQADDIYTRFLQINSWFEK
jgi:protein SCO1/2